MILHDMILHDTQRLTLCGTDATSDLDDFAADVRDGLTSTSKRLSCRFIYDEPGSVLFEKICALPEYYLTRAEAQILEDRSHELGRMFDECPTIVELGSGSSVKTRIILRALSDEFDEVHYVPIDISTEMLTNAANDLLDMFPKLNVTGFAGEYNDGLRFVHDEIDGPTCMLWLGSSVGNLTRDVAADFLTLLRENMDDEDRVLAGIDLKKDAAILRNAYNDNAGITRRFNQNLLLRINRELGGDFDVDAFDYKVIYNSEIGRVEMYQVSRVSQEVHIRDLDLTVSFEQGESIHTENSHKYSLDDIDALAARSGMEKAAQWFDDERRFSLNLFKPS